MKRIDLKSDRIILKQRLILIILIFIPAFLLAGWFWQNPQPQGNPLWSIYFIDNNTGYTAGSAGTILKTTNDGNN